MEQVVANALDLVRQVGDELDAAREMQLRLAERILAAHEVLARLAERRAWDGTEADYCPLGEVRS